jgi:putative Ca2+/H+ antiporter (TMEM165/GDT1 family)
MSFAILVLAVGAGFLSTPDPLENILPLLVWTGFWVAFTLLTALLGNLWPWLNPWTGPLRLTSRLSGRSLGRQPIVRLPERLGYLAAIIQFLVFAWYELVSLAPDNPDALALAVTLYWLFNFAMMVIFGEAEWMRRAEPFSVFFRLVGMMSPFVAKPSRIRPGRLDIRLQWPGRLCLDHASLTPSGIVFVVLTLAAVSFDGFSRTFAWFMLIGVNPLEFEGRSQVQLANSLGLAGAVLVLMALYMAAVWAGCRLVGVRSGSTFLRLAGLFVLSLLPISIAFHASHYLTVLLVNGQYLLAALSDPFASGIDLFGTAGRHVTTSFLANLEDVTLIWQFQTAVIVTGHIVGIAIAHAIAVRHFSSVRQAVLSQSFLALGMVGFTVFGLWLLSTLSTG